MVDGAMNTDCTAQGIDGIGIADFSVRGDRLGREKDSGIENVYFPYAGSSWIVWSSGLL